MKLTNILARFRLVTLHLRMKGIEYSNFKFLFERWPMLVELTIFYCNGHTEMFHTIKNNCQQLEVIQLVVDKSKGRLDRRSLENIRSMFPKTAFNIVDVETAQCL